MIDPFEVRFARLLNLVFGDKTAQISDELRARLKSLYAGGFDDGRQVGIGDNSVAEKAFVLGFHAGQEEERLTPMMIFSDLDISRKGREMLRTINLDAFDLGR